MNVRTLALGVLPLLGCSTMSKIVEPTKGATVYRLTQGSAGGHANIYWFETPAGPVVLDAPLTKTETKKLRAAMVQPYRIYVTSGQAERFGGLDLLRAGDVPAFTTPAIATEIQSYGNNRLAAARAKWGDEVPASVAAPSPAVEERTHDMVGEVELELLPLGPAQTEAAMAIYIPKTGELITGDVVAGGEHLDLTWGRSVAWQDRINELKALEPKRVYPGHGTPGGPELLDQTLEYLKFFHDTVADKVKPGAPAKLTAADLADLKKKMLARFPKLGAPERIEKSLAGEYAVQLAALPPQAAPEPSAAPPAATPPSATPPSATPASAANPTEAKPAAAPTAADELLGGGGDKGEKKKGKKKK